MNQGMSGGLPRPSMLIPLIVACALFMENLDATIITTALPPIARSLHEDPLRLSLAITAYLLSLAVFIPLSGWVADRYGARRVFRSAIIVFTCGSMLCGAAQNMPELVAARILQGIGGAMMVPVGRLVLLRNVPKSELVTAISYLTVPALLAPLLGAPLGGLIATYASWRWIFYINLPIGLLGYWLVSRYIAEVREAEPRQLDLRGWSLLGAGLAGLVFGFETLGKDVLPPTLVWTMLGAGTLLVGGYALYARGRARVILDLSLLRIPTFAVVISAGSLFRVGIGAFTLLMPLLLQLGFGMTPLRSGLLTFGGAIGAMLMKLMAARIVRRFGFRSLLIANSVIAGTYLLACGLLRPEVPQALIVALMLSSGFFSSLQFTCLNAIAFADVTESRMSQATSFSSTAQQLSLSVGVGLAAQLLHLRLALRHEATLLPADFTWAFAILAAITVGSALLYLRLPTEAGASVSGRPARAFQR